MGCSSSKLDDQESVQLCRDRRNFIKQAVEQRLRFASEHLAYIQALRRVSLALLNFAEGDKHHDFFSGSCITPPFTPVKRLSPEIIGIPLSFSSTPSKTEKSTNLVVNYLKSSGISSVPVEEWPQSPETARVESYYPSDHYGIDGFFTSQGSPANLSFSSSPYNRPSYPPPSPQNSQWDFFWNPFSSLDQYGYRLSDALENEIARVRQVREEEGIPELEDEGEGKDEVVLQDISGNEKVMEAEAKDETHGSHPKPTLVEVDGGQDSAEAHRNSEKVHELKGCQAHGVESIEVSKAQRGEIEETSEQVARNSGAEETPVFSVYVNRRPTDLVEVMKDVENQFVRICNSAREVSVMLEASRAKYSSTSNELGVRMLNPVALFHSPSLRSSSSRYFQTTSSSRDDDDDDNAHESSSNYSEECCMISGSHQSTLERLYAWEKKLYDEVKSGERIHLAYEKKCMQLRNHDVNGEEPSVVDKTRAAIRDLHTRLKVSIHSVESISKRIEVLRDQELYPQLKELIEGLARMWSSVADCHRMQKRTIDEAKLLLFSSSSTSATAAAIRPSELTPPKPSKAAANLAMELRNWRTSLAAWLEAQQSYARALAGWISTCGRCHDDAAADEPQRPPPRSPFLAPGQRGRVVGAPPPPVFGICVRWARVVESVSGRKAVQGIEFFAAGVGSVIAPPEKRGEEGDLMVAADVGERVVCAGMAAAAGALAEYAGGLAEGYEGLVKGYGGRDGSWGESQINL